MTLALGRDGSLVTTDDQHTRAQASLYSRLIRLTAIVCLSSFALSGTLKEFPVLTSIPVDLTQLTAVLGFGSGLLYRLDTRTLPSRSQLFMLALFMGIVLLGAAGAVATEYGDIKVSKALQVSFLGTLVASLAIRTHQDLKVFLKVFLVTAFTVGLPLAAGVEGYRDQFGRFTSEQGSTINLGQAAGAVLFSIAAYFLVRSDRLTLMKLGALAVAGGVSTFVLLGVGSRGPIQGLIVALAFAAVASLQSSTRKASTRMFTLVGAAIAVIFAVWSSTPENSRERITDFSGNSTADTRVRLWQATWDRLDFNLFGLGFGSWEQLDIDGYTYPHNMFLEFWYETGLISIVLLLLFFSIPLLTQWYNLKVDPLAAVIASGIVVYYWAGAMVSGDLNDHRALWVFAVATAVSFRSRPEVET
jgi:O-antigen ligase